jgi:signal transduction histidine kinase
MNLSEDVISAPSPKEILRRLQSDLPLAIGAESVDVFVYNRTNDRLERIPSESSMQPFSVSIDEPIGTFYSTVAVCFRNRTLLDVPDTRRSPIFSESENQVPASAVFVPMIAHRDLLGVMAAYYRKPARKTTPERQTALQHLANQIAASLQLQEQQHMREQLLRSEKLAAAGQLISGVANDLRAPLENVSRTARSLLSTPHNGVSELREIAADAERGLDVVSHLLAFARMERTEAKPVDLFAVVNTLLDVRADDRARKGVTVETKLPLSPLEVLADQPQLEQAFLSVLVQAEHAASLSPDKSIRIASRIVGKRVSVTFECPSSPAADGIGQETDTDYFGMPVAQAIVQSHGGEIRSASGQKDYRLEVELPVHTGGAVMEKPAIAAQSAVRVLTAVIVEPDAAAQRRLLSMLAARGHRGIPANGAEHAADLIQRMPFDIVFCAVRLPGLNWVELFQRVRRRVGAFALMTEGYDAESARAFRAGEGHVLAKPLDERELQEFLAGVEVRQAAARR